ncbi:hypothetical protein HH310_33355 [Actinoplanes sp. TBRC 11911]|uniref:hypothetical protein n=1 Tax=Actinoplanes sp. TBRC 11911 TaxID=2729386 RepID=UPI00145D8409|nr:hypothetical protein [Actinoplanes sp. TBRC 11911]NMO56055.1 hypothetical protein [Actinoplanes sp. TBRC 11911]
MITTMPVTAPTRDGVAAPETAAGPCKRPVSGLDTAAISQVLAAMPGLATWPTAVKDVRRLLRTAERMMVWLQRLAGDGWQARWQRAEELYGAKWREWPLEQAASEARPRARN